VILQLWLPFINQVFPSKGSFAATAGSQSVIAKPSIKNPFWVLLIVSAILLSIASVYAQEDYLGIRFLRVQQEKVHGQMMQGVAGNPWQYRILADLLVDQLIRVFNELGVSGAEVSAFVVFRFVQDILIFLVAGLYYKKLGLHFYANLIGLSVLAWGMSYSLYNSDLSFSVYFDIVFFLVGAILIIDKNVIWILPLTVLSAFNRETAVLIPCMLLGSAYFGDFPKEMVKRAKLYSTVCLLVFAIIFLGLRVYYGHQFFLTADGYYPGLGLLFLNIRSGITWEQLLITLGIIPLVAILAYQHWPRTLRIFSWIIVPVWFAVHFVAALVPETRLLLVPQALIFIPGALLGFSSIQSQDAQENSGSHQPQTMGLMKTQNYTGIPQGGAARK
jgi:hypothetical protein